MPASTSAPRAPVHIGQVVRNALLFHPKRNVPMPSTDLLASAARLFALLDEQRVEYVLVGGLALLHYVESRNTEDIDLIVALPDLQRVPGLVVEAKEAYFARASFEGLRVDVLLPKNKLFALVRKRYVTPQRFVERTIPCVTVEGLLLLKLYALPSLYRQQDFARVSLYESDVALLIQAYQPDLAPLYDLLTPHLGASDVAAVQEVVAEIQQRIARFGQGFS